MATRTVPSPIRSMTPSPPPWLGRFSFAVVWSSLLSPLLTLLLKTASAFTIAFTMAFSMPTSLPPRVAAAEPLAGDVEFFEKRIRPVLAEHCYACHSADAKQQQKLKGGLLLDSRAGSRAGGDTGPAVVPKEVGRSLLIAALRHEGGLEMPPTGKLPEAVIADFVKWIETGAADPRDGTTASSTAKSAGMDWDAAKRHWAFQPPQRHPLPAVKNTDWPRTGIDHFVLAALEERNLRPVAFAPKRTWLRRVTFDLIGLPPTADELRDFELDGSPQAAARAIDRLLASPHYGERWARHWLDVARYADDKALAFVNPWPHSYRYRDWVVRAFAEDMPYDEFLRLQLAGDLLPGPVDDYPRRLAGLGFQGLGAVYHKGNVGEQVKADEIDDRIDTLTRGLLGLTVACARCHDHKYDPIPTRDYYALAAAYNGAGWDELQLAAPAEIARYQTWDKEAKAKQTALNQWLEARGRELGQSALKDVERLLLVAWQTRILQLNKVAFDDAKVAEQEKVSPFFLSRCRKLVESITSGKPPEPLAAWAAVVVEESKQPALDGAAVSISGRLREATAKLAADIRAAVAIRVQSEKLDAPQESLLKAIWLDPKAPFAVTAKEAADQLSPEQKLEHDAQQAAIAAHAKSAPPEPQRAHGVTGGGGAMRIYIRGNVLRPGDVAPPGFLQVLNSAPAVPGSPEPSPSKFTRLDLAHAIATRDNPLTARVIVNRVWRQHFGRGLVATPSNFGQLGDRPTHPELLDTLAVRFMESGWSLKWLHREILLSAAYQLAADHDREAAAVDPDNRWLWRFAPRRMEIESWRDAVLVASGRLNRTLGGPSTGLAEAAHIRRTLYGKVSRLDPDKLLVAFDFPDANVSSEQRHTTIVPQQQLFVLNSEFMLASAREFAGRIERFSPDVAARVEFSYQEAFGRPPTSDEAAAALDFVRSTSASEDKQNVWEQLAHALLAANEFTWIE